MKTLFTMTIFSWATYAFGQNCKCEMDTIHNELISCEKIKFDNHASLYWNYNCDSSWLTYESDSHKKIIIFSLGDGLQDLAGRLGYIFAQEYRNSFLIQNNVISGCCSPPEYYLFNKTRGRLKTNLGRVIFYGTDKNFPFIIRVTNSNYDNTSFTNYNSLSIYNIDKEKLFYIELPKGQLKKALEATEQNYPEYLFDEPIVKGTSILLTYYIKRPDDKNKKSVKTIFIDSKKYKN